MQLHNQPLNQTFLSCPVLGSRVLLECLCFQVPIPKFLLLMVATHAASSSLTVTVREHSLQPNARAMERTERHGYVTHSKERRQGKREREKQFKFRYLLTETQKRTHIQAPLWQKSQHSGLRSFASSKDLPEAPQEPSPPLTHTQKRTEECSALPAQVYLRFNESVIH